MMIIMMIMKPRVTYVPKNSDILSAVSFVKERQQMPRYAYVLPCVAR